LTCVYLRLTRTITFENFCRLADALPPPPPPPPVLSSPVTEKNEEEAQDEEVEENTEEKVLLLLKAKAVEDKYEGALARRAADLVDHLLHDVSDEEGVGVDLNGTE
jgi:hypothetical protein